MLFLTSNKKEMNETLKKTDLSVVFILGIAIFLRFFLLDQRPIHHDEAVFGWFADQINVKGFYKYDPTNYHGPIHFYILFVFQKIFGRGDFALRLPDAVISTLSVYLVILFSRFFNRKTCLIAALALAVSPGMSYFGRFAFQEAFLVFYSILVLLGIIGLLSEGTKQYLWILGIGLTLMILTKETYIIHIGCFVIAFFCLWILNKFILKKEFEFSKQQWAKNDLSLLVIISVGLIIFFYSGTFFNFQGVQDLFKSIENWFHTGVKGVGHNKPFVYWLNLFSRYEYCGLIGFFASLYYLFKAENWRVNYLSIYAIGVFLVYSLIPYKTPWCIINIIWPFCFIFGELIKNILSSKWKDIGYCLSAGVFLFGFEMSYRLNFINFINDKEPYVYVQTYESINKLTKPFYELVKQDSRNYNLRGLVLRTDEWPIPWYLGKFNMISYYRYGYNPYSYDADFLAVESKRIKEVESKLTGLYFTDIFKMRAFQDLTKLYFRYEIFRNVIPGKSPESFPRQ